MKNIYICIGMKFFFFFYLSLIVVVYIEKFLWVKWKKVLYDGLFVMCLFIDIVILLFIWVIGGYWFSLLFINVC